MMIDLLHPLVTAADLACRRGERILFSGFGLTLLPGQVVWLRGANGRGKTSLLRLLAGLARPETGRIAHRPHTACLYLAHTNALKDDLSVAECLRFLARLQNAEADAEAHAHALRCFGLHAQRDAPVRTLSQGQRRRVALARLYFSPPDALWLLDEPFDALDADGVAALNTLLAAHAARGGAVLLTSHVPLTLAAPRPIECALDEALAA